MNEEPIRRVRELEVFSNQFGRLYDDEVVNANGVSGRYLRWVWSHGGVMVIARCGEDVALCKMYRYPINQPSLEVPRGGVDDGESHEQAALRELREETGLVGGVPRVLGRVYADTGLIAQPVVVVEVQVEQSAPTNALLEPMESAEQCVWMTPAQIQRAIGEGNLRCALSIAGLSLSRAL